MYEWHERGNWLSRIDCKELQPGNRSRQNKYLADSGRNENQSEWCTIGRSPLLSLSRSAGSFCSLSWFSLLPARTEGREWLFPVGALMMPPLFLELGQKACFKEKVRSACRQVNTHIAPESPPNTRCHDNWRLPTTPASSPQSGTCMISSPIPHHLWESSDYSQGGKGGMKPRVKSSAFLITFDTSSLFLMSPLPLHHQRDHERLKKKKQKKNSLSIMIPKFKIWTKKKNLNI